jgi:fatty acid desaturase
MWTDLVFNLVLLLMSDYIFVLAASTVCYMVFNFLNLNAGWIHRMDRADTPRPWRAPTVMIGIGAFLAFFNALLLGWGVSVWGSGAMATGLVAVALIVPVFCYRHFVQDKGVFPASMYDSADDSGLASGPPTKRAGMLPYLALAGGVATVVVGQLLAAAAS